MLYGMRALAGGVHKAMGGSVLTARCRELACVGVLGQAVEGCVKETRALAGEGEGAGPRRVAYFHGAWKARRVREGYSSLSATRKEEEEEKSDV